MAGMDAETVKAIADLARRGAQLRERFAEGDGIMRLGAARELRELAPDFDASADALTPRSHHKR